MKRVVFGIGRHGRYLAWRAYFRKVKFEKGAIDICA
jgi:hypothetical protein